MCSLSALCFIMHSITPALEVTRLQKSDWPWTELATTWGLIAVNMSSRFSH